ncbi:cytochrome c oxidase subunit III [Methylobacterium sp. 4-46]|uniref:cytochrome c oxidase subunit 3 family protein n=1 Tax=unclassified Methylobacterium TaxID=2615210 RepID=UPI000152CC4F|nr:MULTISPECIES: cytochrome c oxidase subunit 3 family protein [Methylobacterium]ACA20102.1 cytochrome c oxidase subunit III [Methylobacterium sp. 4-46]WFT79286.1 cytochrome c oxidase subunit 3 family protein [Methylobacterium nodulans]
MSGAAEGGVAGGEPAARLIREPWSDLGRQRRGATFGIWLFLASETLFFGALLLTYAVMRIAHPEAFAAAGRETNLALGTANTAILLTSSLTMAVASQAAKAEEDLRRLVVACLAVTAALGLAFVAVKGVEYREDIEKSLVPGPHFPLAAAPAQIFFALYWLMTGVHALHLSVGIALVGRLALLGWRGRLELRGSPEVEVTALYWHLVDVVWIVLYPVFYLPGRSG